MLTVLCYHKVGPESEEGRFINVEPRRLRSHVRFWKRRGCEIIAARDLANAWPRKAVCFTFDDAYVSTLTHGLEVLTSEGVTASIYAVSEKVGKTSDWDGNRARPLADWDLLRNAQSEGIEIGNHSATHPKFAQLTLDEQIREIQQCQERLESEGLRPGSFCFPYGSLKPDSEEALTRAGQRVGLALGQKPAKLGDPRWAIPRVVIAFSHTMPMVLYKIYVRPHLP